MCPCGASLPTKFGPTVSHTAPKHGSSLASDGSLCMTGRSGGKSTTMVCTCKASLPSSTVSQQYPITTQALTSQQGSLMFVRVALRYLQRLGLHSLRLRVQQVVTSCVLRHRIISVLRINNSRLYSACLFRRLYSKKRVTAWVKSTRKGSHGAIESTTIS